MKTHGIAVMALLLTAVALTACSPASPTLKSDEDRLRAELNLKPAKWPLKFKEHTFIPLCYSTLACKVSYAGPPWIDDKPSPPSSTYGPKYLDHIMGGHVGISNFPDPAEVTWRSMDGVEHKALIDIGAIFRDRVVRHNVPREEVAELVHGKLSGNPLILLEVNDRTIRVYMRAFIPTKHLSDPDNPLSDRRDELVLARTYQY
ncbi:hypothetical protein [Luteibacter yeojuensis]|uniref:Uncharacterized protein n=1 Tax=Luteibacter yeojuensis TaxID=345309 RepID=A0A7X5QVN1_9GAMM|nr:hypothetical protein [Luteibacter yeojuensis]NID16253.1 hypothetical protein [Luteibacter yeojuensis]